MTDEKPKPAKDEETGRFLPGNSGGDGRPKGHRNKLGELFLRDLVTSWEESGIEAIRQVIETKPEAYLRVVASLMPQDLNVNVNQIESMTDEQLIERIRRLDAAIAPFLDANGTGLGGGGDRPETAH